MLTQAMIEVRVKKIMRFSLDENTWRGDVWRTVMRVYTTDDWLNKLNYSQTRTEYIIQNMMIGHINNMNNNCK